MQIKFKYGNTNKSTIHYLKQKNNLAVTQNSQTKYVQ